MSQTMQLLYHSRRVGYTLISTCLFHIIYLLIKGIMIISIHSQVISIVLHVVM
uniref:Uncharacterized protein n=1 Tax=Solanum lycopersicum TaxID=4081 RepID=A0A3Q7IHH0_SOLLC